MGTGNISYAPPNLPLQKLERKEKKKERKEKNKKKAKSTQRDLLQVRPMLQRQGWRR
jgi:hypothetical protein